MQLKNIEYSNWIYSWKIYKNNWKWSWKINLKYRIKSISNLISNNFLFEEPIYELNKLIEMEQNINRDDLIYQIGNEKKDKTCDIQKFKTITQ